MNTLIKLLVIVIMHNVFVTFQGATCGILTGFLTMIWITINSFILDKSHIHLPFSAEECPIEVLEQYNVTSSILSADVEV